MRKLFLVMLVSLAVVVPAAAAKKGNSAHLPATLVLASQTSTTATFQVTADLPSGKYKNIYDLWVANLCFDAQGVEVTAEYQAVQWPSGSAGPFATDGTSPFAGPIVSCSAYVWYFPDFNTPVSNTITYSP